MRTYLIILVMISGSSMIAQEEPLINKFKEIFCQTYDVGTTEKVVFQISAASQVYDNNYELATSYMGESLLNSEFEIEGNHNGTDYGWDHIGGLSGIPESPYYGYGHYYFTVTSSEHPNDPISFYIDGRDCDHVSADYPHYYPCSQDIWLQYHGNNSIVIIPGYACKDDSVTIYSQNSGQSFTLWGLKNKSTATQTCFQIYLTFSKQNKHPYLQWSSVGSFPAGFNLYRVIDQIITESFFVTGTFFLDNDITIVKGPKIHSLEYWVKGIVPGQGETIASNTVGWLGDFILQKDPLELYCNEDDGTFELLQNNPNPFNPVTMINYSIAQPTDVRLSVFNSIGEEIEVLVNGIEEEGYYSVPFDASNLPSGVYFYQITTDYFSDVKKMVVTK